MSIRAAASRSVVGAFVALLLLAGAPTGRAWAGGVFINGVPLDDAAERMLQGAYGIPVPAGRYWYDAVAGIWGFEGGPAIGQIQAGLRLGGGRLRADASGGNTGVFVNGRQLHADDLAALQRCMPLRAGRYWMGPNGVGGREGAPASFDLKAACGG
jgi:hypothetical protein